jgi:hypothetical protein
VPSVGRRGLLFMLDWPGSAPPLDPPWPVSAEASLRTAYPKLAFRTGVVLTGRIRVQIFGSPGARHDRYGLPDSLLGSELRRALRRVRSRPPLSALP